MRVALLAPIENSLYSRVVAHLAAIEPGVELGAVVVRTPWTLSRIQGEFRRDGARLLQKVRTKLILGEERVEGRLDESIGALTRDVGLPEEGLERFASRLKIPFLSTADHNMQEALDLLREARQMRSRLPAAA